MFGLFFFVDIADSKGILLYSTRNLLKGTQPGLFRSNNRQKETHYQPNWAMMIIASIPRSEWRLMQKIIYKPSLPAGLSPWHLIEEHRPLDNVLPRKLCVTETQLRIHWLTSLRTSWRAGRRESSIGEDDSDCDRTEILLVRCVMRWYPVYGIPAHIFI